MGRKQFGDLAYGAVINTMEVKFDTTRQGNFEGYASVFSNIDSWGDIVLPGAFEETLARKDQVPMLFNHFMDNLIGRATDMKEDDIGLQFHGRLTPGASMATDVYQHMKAQALDGVSIGYRVQPGGADMDGKVRKLSRVDLLEISMVIAPANKLARADLGSLKADFDPEEMKSLADVESILRDAGMTRIEAKSMLARVREIVLRDADKGDDSASDVKTEAVEASVLASFIRDFSKA
ncbi:HK97 family phage prohead protease [Paraburkholderia dipogonis]|uniref:HK97 family phage prohead protease n=1 Tax=Paraburkholderia dipogonis TaxID=1211383 RepID=UPI0038BA7F59